MGKLVQDQVATAREVAALMDDDIPREYNRPTIPRLSQAPVPAFVNDPVSGRKVVGNSVGCRVDQHGQHPAEMVTLHAQEEEASLCGNGYLDLVRDGETAATLPVLFGNEHPHVVP